MSTTRSWFREPMVWLVWGLPFTAVVAGIWTLVVAIRSGGSDQVIDQVSRMAQVQQSNLDADREARRLGLSASLVLSQRDVVVQLGGRWPNDAPLALRLNHPTDARQDLQLTLTPAEGKWVAEVQADRRIAWQLQLADTQGRWRLDGIFNQAQGFATLTPRFSDG